MVEWELLQRWNKILHKRKRSYSDEGISAFDDFLPDKSPKRIKLKENEEEKTQMVQGQDLLKMKEEKVEEIDDEEKKEIVESIVGHCQICLSDIQMQELHCLDGCSHIFHKECLQMYLETSIDSNKIPLICPIVECK